MIRQLNSRNVRTFYQFEICKFNRFLFILVVVSLALLFFLLCLLETVLSAGLIVGIYKVCFLHLMLHIFIEIVADSY